MSSVRMHDVSPASGVVSTPGSRLSDRELMQHVIREHDLKRMLQTTAHRPSGMGGGPIALPAALVKALRRSARPGRVPTVRQLLKRGMKVDADMLRSLIDPDELPDVDGLGVKAEQITHNGWTYVARNPNWNGGSVLTGWARTGTGSTNPSHGHSYFNDQFSEGSAYSGFASGALAQWYHLHSIVRESFSAGVWRHETKDQWHILGPYGPLSAPSYSARRVLAGDRRQQRVMSRSDRRMTLPSNRQLQRRMPAYRRPAVEIEVRPDRNGEIAPPSPPTRTTHRDVPAKRQKKAIVGGKLGQALLGAYHTATEINDFFEALADAIPGNPCGNLPGFHRALCVINNSDRIDPVQAGINLVANEIEDRLVAKAQGQLGKLTEAGGPNTTQMNQWQRTLQGLLR